MQSSSRTLAVVIGLLVFAHPVVAQTGKKDEFFWLGQINKATAVINTDEGLLDKSIAPLAYQGISKVLKDGNQPGGKRPTPFEARGCPEFNDYFNVLWDEIDAHVEG